MPRILSNVFLTARNAFIPVLIGTFSFLLIVQCGKGTDPADSDSPRPVSRSAYFRHDRSQNRLAYDYGWNILNSLEPDAILFTQGDNDTFPLWYLQEAAGVRRDVRVVNLSILNAPWYIKQLRDEGRTIPIELSDDFIDRRLTGGGMLSFPTLRWPPQAAEVTVSGITWEMPPTYLTGDGTYGILSAAHYMIVHIIDRVSWSRPIYFTSAVAPRHFIGLEPYLSYEGMVFRLTDTRSPSGTYRVDTGRLALNLSDRYRLGGITDPSVYRPPETARLLSIYFSAFLELMDGYHAEGNRTEARAAAQKARLFAQGDPYLLGLLDTAMRERGIAGTGE